MNYSNKYRPSCMNPTKFAYRSRPTDRTHLTERIKSGVGNQRSGIISGSRPEMVRERRLLYVNALTIN